MISGDVSARFVTILPYYTIALRTLTTVTTMSLVNNWQSIADWFAFQMITVSGKTRPRGTNERTKVHMKFKSICLPLCVCDYSFRSCSRSRSGKYVTWTKSLFCGVSGQSNHAVITALAPITAIRQLASIGRVRSLFNCNSFCSCSSLCACKTWPAEVRRWGGGGGGVWLFWYIECNTSCGAATSVTQKSTATKRPEQCRARPLRSSPTRKRFVIDCYGAARWSPAACPVPAAALRFAPSVRPSGR